MKIMIKIPIFCLSRRLGHKGLTKNYLSKYRVETLSTSRMYHRVMSQIVLSGACHFDEYRPETKQIPKYIYIYIFGPN